MTKNLLFVLRMHTLVQAIITKQDAASLRAIAEEIGVSSSSLSRIKRGADMDMQSFLLICTWLNRPPSDFFTNRQAGSQPICLPKRVGQVQPV